MTIVDYPGDDRLRKHLFSHWLSDVVATVKGVVFVVDSASFPKTQRDVAELLYDVLVHLPSKIPVLVACNKQDVDVAKSEQVIQSSLEKEFNLLNSSHQASLGMTEGKGGGESRVLTKETFKWDKYGRDVEFCECANFAAAPAPSSGKDAGSSGDDDGEEDDFDLEGVEDWMDKL